MKPRKVILTLEVMTAAPLRWLTRTRRAKLADAAGSALADLAVIQAQANVVGDDLGPVPAPPKAKRRR